MRQINYIVRTRQPLLRAWILGILGSIIVFVPKIAMAQYGIKLGTVASSFYYPGNAPQPYNDFDVDLRPYLGYDIELTQTNPQKPLIAFFISVYRKINLSEKFDLQPEISFAQKGVDFSANSFEKIIYRVRISYLEFPLTLSYRFLQGNKSSFHGALGGYGALRMNGVKKVAYYNSSQSISNINSTHQFDYGFLLGLNYRYQINEHFLLFDIRAFMGLNDLFGIPNYWTPLYYETHQTKITGLYLSLGYEL